MIPEQVEKARMGNYNTATTGETAPRLHILIGNIRDMKLGKLERTIKFQLSIPEPLLVASTMNLSDNNPNPQNCSCIYVQVTSEPYDRCANTQAC